MIVAVNASALTGAPRGLANVASSCYINGALQIITASPRLRAIVLRGLAEDHPLTRFFDAYDNADDATLIQRHAEVTGHIRTLRPKDFTAGLPCTSSEVLQVLRVPSTEIIGELNALHREIAQGSREFNIGSDANVRNMQYDALRAAGDLHSFLYFTGGHYIAFVRHDAQWYRADDHRVHAVGEAEIQALPVQASIDKQGRPIARECLGIIFASYANPLP